MKCILFLFILVFSLKANAQTQSEIELHKNLDEARMGVWVKGDYKIYVELARIETMFSVACQNYENSLLYYNDKDTNLVKYYRANSKRYQTVVDQIKNAKNSFDLRTLIIYEGVENMKQNVGNSSLLEYQIKHFVQQGNAKVLYKGERIFTLKCKTELKEEGGILNRGYEIRTFFDDIDNCIFNEYRHMGW